MNDHEKNGPEEEEVSASTTAVSFKQYGGNAAENYERYFVPTIGTAWAIALLDASEPLSEQDQRVIAAVTDAGRALVIAYNKWDLVDEDRRDTLEREASRDLARVQWAPRVNVSALTGRSVDKLAAALRTSLESWDRRIPTGRLNAWLADVVTVTPPPGRGGKVPRVLFATQADSRPPRFVLFATGFLEAGYRRFIERRLREDFDFTGTPIEISVRVRERRGTRR